MRQVLSILPGGMKTSIEEEMILERVLEAELTFQDANREEGYCRPKAQRRCRGRGYEEHRPLGKPPAPGHRRGKWLGVEADVRKLSRTRSVI